MKPISLTLFFKPAPKSQVEAWQIYKYFKNDLLNQDRQGVQLLDFQIPRTSYYGIPSYMNKVMIRLRPTSEEGLELIDKIKTNGIPSIDQYAFWPDKRDENAIHRRHKAHSEKIPAGN